MIHSELELIQANKFIQHLLSHYLMEGRYNKLFLAKNNSPADCYSFFINILLDTVRNEISACLELAYARASVK
jgi:26S proteasome regulatory subunit N12